MPTPLLFQQIVPVDDAQLALTEKHLIALGPALEAYFLELRRETDVELVSLPPAVAGSPYPYGRCEEITGDLHKRLTKRLENPGCEVERAIRRLMAEGGAFRRVWGVLRDQYFQNALQLGGLYVDVSNDTVVVTKPKVEILPMEGSGLVSVRDLAHFRQTAERYWKASIYANHLVPSLAPVLPMISASLGRLAPGLQSACNYMIELMCLDGFRQAEAWLRDGPAPPPEVAEAVLAGVPAGMRPAFMPEGRSEAVAACQRARAANVHADPAWRRERIMDYLGMMEFRRTQLGAKT
ncbi:hypothetical protein N825_10855 [Skermanella stibiiresistens SB22]|uniref:Uncharacterized protein n=1 Tax=Skermanella stibiiresistens SB22 TaxID=1385369 RepID=W9H1W0_9PROT|nr:hypothetical protein [Skermanella stibiiresistens]EWY38687.1 hypothetical protein N825_10855 [Skermanella stibiiresistens SB22]